MELAAKLTDEHLEKAKELLDEGHPEYVVSGLLGIPYMTWKFWKREAKKIRQVVQDNVQQFYDNGLLAKDGTLLGFVIYNSGDDIISRHESKEEAENAKERYYRQNGLSDREVKVKIENETKQLKELYKIKTNLRFDQLKVVTLLTLCEKGKAYTISKHIKNITKHSDSDWKASAWWLERTDRENFGRNETVNVNANVGISSIELTKEEEAQYKANLASVFGTLKGGE